ncbi:hypothetical protein [Candidatus Uabimicrobium amorphum]|uniref:Uncharacterized protein n=1 Tax=Uabimicrobium amorphum TaxID=2596890 RepID=A0A5S9F5J4_UABAM|nr:hypothetical protein [Candidatus Uabimicrobium amorphum]BBM86672.1 hypothetical protein UABAM_05058 [Candidatus Uabimicrobium amorphum]
MVLKHILCICCSLLLCIGCSSSKKNTKPPSSVQDSGMQGTVSRNTEDITLTITADETTNSGNPLWIMFSKKIDNPNYEELRNQNTLSSAKNDIRFSELPVFCNIGAGERQITIYEAFAQEIGIYCFFRGYEPDNWYRVRPKNCFQWNIELGKNKVKKSGCK